MEIPLVLERAVLPVIWPEFTMAWAKGDRKELDGRIRFLTKATMWVGFFYAGTMVFGGPWFLEIWSRRLVHVKPVLLAVLGFLVVIRGLMYWLSTFLHSVSDFGFEVLCYGATILIMFVLGWPLVRLTGMVGVPLVLGLGWLFGCYLPMRKRISDKWLQ
jgi:O-antigen/teichoic acid export membrane protein